ncbi:MAG: SPOR domain-containing protein [Magnetococcus sp. THC-1_WYH]
MKTSSNREQQLFLVTGGAILFLILAVVVFNMISTPSAVPEKHVEPVSKVLTAESQTAEATQEPHDAWKINIGPGVNPPAPQSQDNTVYLTPREIQTPTQAQAESDPAAAPATAIDPLGKSRQMLESTPVVANAEPKATAPAPKTPSMEPKATAPAPKTPPVATNHAAAAPAPTRPEPEARHQAEKPVAEKPINKQQPAPVKVVKAPEKPVPPPEPPKAAQAPKTDYSEAIAQVIAKQFNPSETAAAKRTVPSKQQPPEVSKPPATSSGSSYQIQIASFSTSDKAKALADRVGAVVFQGRRMPVSQSNITVNGKSYFRVRAGPFVNRNNAEAALQALSQKAGVSGSILAQD